MEQEEKNQPIGLELMDTSVNGMKNIRNDLFYTYIIMPRLIALICKRESVSAEEFQNYYEKNHVPLIESLFPTLRGYKRTYLLESDMLNDALPLESDNNASPFDVITELTFDDEESLDQFFARGADEEVVDAIRNDEANFLDGEKTIMYRVE